MCVLCVRVCVWKRRGEVKWLGKEKRDMSERKKGEGESGEEKGRGFPDR